LISTTTLFGLIVWIAGAAASLPAVVIAGGAMLLVAAIAYAGTTLWSLVHSTTEHRLPKEFVLAAMIWLLVAALFGGATLAGYDLSAAVLFALLVGWAGQTVNAHLMHTGVRLLATLAIDSDDETEPIDLLDRRLGAASLLINQGAVLLGVLGLATRAGGLIQAAAALGVCAMLAMGLNVLHALKTARAT